MSRTACWFRSAAVSKSRPTFFLNWQNGVNYNLVEQTPQYAIQSLQDLQNIPITSTAATRPEILADVASITRSNEMAVLNHYNIRRVVDIYASVQDRDLGGAGRDITRIVDANRGICCRAAASSPYAANWTPCGPPISACWPVSASPSCWSIC